VSRRADVPLPAALTGGALAPGAVPTVGLRVPAHDAPRALARILGPLPTTSANRSGEPELGDAEAIEAELGAAIDLILDGGQAHGGPASTVVDCTGPEPVIRRPGAIPGERIEAALRMWDDTRP
jgi:tRNA A37 threonylcarbamoyladenosine synthetase subunit TsaC/SUA5/YrdC